VQGQHEAGFQRIDWTADSVKLLTLHSAKGLEFPLVGIAGLQRLPWRGEPLEAELRLLYVGMTRATHRLLLAAHGEDGAPAESPVLARVQAALEAVARALPAGAG
jgi:superfamily I DNA/RNA helicase